MIKIDAGAVDSLNKVGESPEAALADLHDGASIAVSGFGTSYGFACSLLVAARDKGVKNLTLVSNGLGAVGQLRGMLLVASGQVGKLIVSFSSRPGMRTPADDLIESGDIEVELVPQGTLVERMRAGGAGIPAFYTPDRRRHADRRRQRGARTSTASRTSSSRRCRSTTRSCRAYRADPLGNVELRGSSRNFDPAFAKAARVAIVEVDEIVEVGEIPPERVGLPGILVDRVVKKTVEPDQARLAPRRAADKPREYNGKPGWTRHEMAATTAGAARRGQLRQSRARGMPTLVSNYIAGPRHHAARRKRHPGLRRAWSRATRSTTTSSTPSGQFVSSATRARRSSTASTSFEMARSGKLHAVVLGAYQVDQAGQPGQLQPGRSAPGRHRRRDGPGRRQADADHHDGAPRQQGPAEAGATDGVPADRRRLRRRGRHRPGRAPPGEPKAGGSIASRRASASKRSWR